MIKSLNKSANNHENTHSKVPASKVPISHISNHAIQKYPNPKIHKDKQKKKRLNPDAKYAAKFNRASVFKDKTKYDRKKIKKDED